MPGTNHFKIRGTTQFHIMLKNISHNMRFFAVTGCPSLAYWKSFLYEKFLIRHEKSSTMKNLFQRETQEGISAITSFRALSLRHFSLFLSMQRLLKLRHSFFACFKLLYYSTGKISRGRTVSWFVAAWVVVAWFVAACSAST